MQDRQFLHQRQQDSNPKKKKYQNNRGKKNWRGKPDRERGNFRDFQNLQQWDNEEEISMKNQSGKNENIGQQFWKKNKGQKDRTKQDKRQQYDLDEIIEFKQNTRNKQKNSFNFKVIETILFISKQKNELEDYLSKNFDQLEGLTKSIDSIIKKVEINAKIVLEMYFYLIESQQFENLNWVKQILSSNKFKQLLSEYILELRKNTFYPGGTKIIYTFLKRLLNSFSLYFVLTSYDYNLLPLSEVEEFMEFVKKANKDTDELDNLQNELIQIKKIIQDEELKLLQEKQQLVEEQKKKKVYEQELQIQIDYKSCPFEPCQKDFASKFPYFGQIIPLKQEEAYHSSELFFNNHFYILREDCIREMRIAFDSIRQTHINNIDPKEVCTRLYIYENFQLLKGKVGYQGVEYIIRLQPYNFSCKQNKQRLNLQKSSRLLPGSLLIITNTRLNPMIFATVIFTPSQQKSYERTGTIQLAIKFLEKNSEYALENLNELQMEDSSKLLIFENKTYFETYIHYLKSLQSMNPYKLPFKEQIIFGSKQVPYPIYIDRLIKTSQIKSPPCLMYSINLQFSLNQKSSIKENKGKVDIFSDDWPMELKNSLDDSQLKAIQLILRNGIAIIQGPPGTGKTYCGALAIRTLLANQDKWNSRIYREMTNIENLSNPILVVCYTNHALDQFLKHILTFTDTNLVIRLGGRCKDEEIQKCVFKKQKCKIKYDWKYFHGFRQDLKYELSKIIQPEKNISIYDAEQYYPQLINIIIDSFIKITRMQLSNPLSEESQISIVSLWICKKNPTALFIQQVQILLLIT